MATAPQIAIIHTLISKLKISDEDYRVMLSSYGMKSSKGLSFQNAKTFIQTLINMDTGKVYQPSEKPKRFSNLGNREDMAYPEQLRMIEAMWCEVSYAPTIEGKQEAFQKFIKNKWGIERVEWLPRNLVGRVVKTIQAMKQGARKRESN
jgi:hypothetical protein